jgi:subtilisin family serine protease
VEQAGIAVDSRFDQFVTARVTSEQIRRLAGVPEVKLVRSSGEARVDNDEAAGFIGARALNDGFVEGTSYTGDGVLACVIDTGIDYDHPDFVDANGNSRILSIWDQTFDTEGQTPYDQSPMLFDSQGTFDYGTEYLRSDIESGSASTTDTNGHGTHVAGTMGANGRADADGRHAGMAPGVEFIIIRAGSGQSLSTKGAIDGMSYCDKVADREGKPMVANKSLGSQVGPHDGTSEWAQAVDQVIEDGQKAGRAVVIAAGNDGQNPIHILDVVAPGTSRSLELAVTPYTPSGGTQNDIVFAQFWLDRDATVTTTVTSPNGATLTAAPGEIATTVTSNDGEVVLENAVYPGNGDRAITIFAADPTESNTPSDGTWTVEFQNDDASSITINGWVPLFTIGSPPGIVGFPSGDSESTIGIPGTATHAITIGSFMHRWRWSSEDGTQQYRPADENRSGDISLFSSKGPRRDGTGTAYKPEVTAPGQNVISSLSQDAAVASSATAPGGLHQALQGTSMATPVVAGSIALLLEEDPTLTSEEIKALITKTADSDGFTGTVPNTEWGYGRLDVLEAMTQLIDPSASSSYAIYANDGHPDNSFEGFFQLGGSGDDAEAIRFQPQVDGRVPGAYFHLDSAPSNFLDGPLTVEIRDDQFGEPGSVIGSSVDVAPEQLDEGTWNYVDLTGTDATITAGSDYYLVFYPSQPDNTVYLMGENFSASGNTLFLGSSGWQEDSQFDLLVRPIVSNLDGVTELPVELLSFRGVASGQRVSLRWETAYETNNQYFDVQYRRRNAVEESPASWITDGQVDGAGTTSQVVEYEYALNDLDYGSYEFRLRQVDLDGSSSLSKAVQVDIQPTEPVTITVMSSPSPSPRAEITVAQQAPVRATLYDILGREVATLHDGSLAPGETVQVGMPSEGLSSGSYFLRVETNNQTAVERLTVVK